MKSPERISPAAYRDALALYMSTCVAGTQGGLACTCGSPIQVVNCFVSIHTTAFEACAGFGTVEHVLIPYCPNCEDVPKQAGCVHAEYFAAKRSVLDPGGSVIGFRFVM